EEEFFHLKMPQMTELRAFYEEMHFLSLLKELETKDVAREMPATRHHYHLVTQEAELEELSTKLTGHEICIDVETTDIRPMRAELVGIGLGVKEKEAWYVPLNGPLPKAQVVSAMEKLLKKNSF